MDRSAGCAKLAGARRENRTPTLLREPDFESGASASSAIRACESCCGVYPERMFSSTNPGGRQPMRSVLCHAVRSCAVPQRALVPCPPWQTETGTVKNVPRCACVELFIFRRTRVSFIGSMKT